MRGDEFFIGYAPPIPPHLARFVRRVVLALAGGALAWSALAAAGHVPLQGGAFEFGHPVQMTGRIVEHPYPALEVDGGHGSLPSLMLLVAPGKHGADAIVRGMHGVLVTLWGTRIQRDRHTMLEVDPASVVVTQQPATQVAEASVVRDEVEMTGEIVDSKCFLGVMVPGDGKTHADCAALCIRGGIPPALHVQNKGERSDLILLTGPDGTPVHEDAIAVAGQQISVHGSLSQRGGWTFLRRTK